MLKKKIEDALNEQVNAEFWAAYLYLSVSAHFAAEGKAGVAKWFAAQAAEEQQHGLKIFNHIIDMGGRVELKPIVKVPQTWESPLAAFEAALKQEKSVTATIYKLTDLAHEEKDYATENMLHWFISEQIEEEATVAKYVDALKLIGDSGIGIYTFDKELQGGNCSCGCCKK